MFSPSLRSMLNTTSELPVSIVYCLLLFSEILILVFSAPLIFDCKKVRVEWSTEGFIFAIKSPTVFDFCSMWLKSALVLFSATLKCESAATQRVGSKRMKANVMKRSRKILSIVHSSK